MYRGLSVSQIRRMKELVAEKSRLKRMVEDSDYLTSEKFESIINLIYRMI